jgi:hypothetical protein
LVLNCFSHWNLHFKYLFHCHMPFYFLWILAPIYKVLFNVIEQEFLNLRLFLITIAIVLVSFMSWDKACWILKVSVGMLITPPMSQYFTLLYLSSGSLIYKKDNYNAIDISSSSSSFFIILILLFCLIFWGRIDLGYASFSNSFL